ncbi:MAG TPA: CPBP family intramembrane glutamic endopeptidase [Pyrinomonadaceae bacterium]|nr:CPBP family intramembrane glutamic endopeptidase [Pyrinomonadaceae bacterium]
MNDHLSKPPEFSWQLFWSLFVAAVIGIAGIIPAALQIFGSSFDRTQFPPISLPVIITLGVIQNLVLLGLFVGLGLKLSGKVGLGAVLTESWLNGEPVLDRALKALGFGIMAGFFVGVVLVPLTLLLVPHLPKLPFVAAAKLSIWKRFLMCFYGGLYEEIFSRLFLLSLFAWLLNKSWRKDRGQLTNGAFWSANLIVAILFGLGHLPSASLLMPITTLVVVAALTLNGIAAIVFGWLYRQRGLEVAMIGHFTADFVLYVIGPTFLMWRP